MTHSLKIHEVMLANLKVLLNSKGVTLQKMKVEVADLNQSILNYEKQIELARYKGLKRFDRYDFTEKA